MYNFSNVTTLYISAENGSDINMGFLPEEDGLGKLQTCAGWECYNPSP